MKSNKSGSKESWRNCAIVLGALLSFCWLGTPGKPAGPESPKGAGATAAYGGLTKGLPTGKVMDRPQLMVLSPRQGQTFDDTPIVVKLEVKNFKLEAPEPYFGKPGPQNVGHFHITLDSYPLFSANATQVMIGKMAGDNYLPQGKHTLLVELAINNHDPLTPPVQRRVTFYTTHP